MCLGCCLIGQTVDPTESSCPALCCLAPGIYVLLLLWVQRRARPGQPAHDDRGGVGAHLCVLSNAIALPFPARSNADSDFVSSPPVKNIPLPFFGIMWFSPASRLARKRGVSADRHDTWSAGCDGRVGDAHDCRADERRRCGRKSAWSWPPDAEAKLAGVTNANNSGAIAPRESGRMFRKCSSNIQLSSLAKAGDPVRRSPSAQALTSPQSGSHRR